MDFGQHFIIAYDGLAMTPDLKEFCRRFAIGGVILFADNYLDPAQLSEAVDEIARECRSGPPLFISCDHEGGRVQRFRNGFTQLPPMAELGAGDPAETRALLAIAARELAQCGVNLNFAPVADLCPADRPGAIGDRSFGTDAQRVSQHVVAAIEAYQTHGVMACVKHFPGHGATDVDSHRALPVLRRSDAMAANDLEPFISAVAAGVGGVMTAHVVAPAPGAASEPASLSTHWIETVLRGQIGFDGLVFSDAMEMTAIRDRWTPADAGRRALEAGTDIIIFYIIEEQLRAIHDLSVAHAAGRLGGAWRDRSLSRILRAKNALPVSIS